MAAAAHPRRQHLEQGEQLEQPQQHRQQQRQPQRGPDELHEITWQRAHHAAPPHARTLVGQGLRQQRRGRGRGGGALQFHGAVAGRPRWCAVARRRLARRAAEAGQEAGGGRREGEARRRLGRARSGGLVNVVVVGAADAPLRRWRWREQRVEHARVRGASRHGEQQREQASVREQPVEGGVGRRWQPVRGGGQQRAQHEDEAAQQHGEHAEQRRRLGGAAGDARRAEELADAHGLMVEVGKRGELPEAGGGDGLQRTAPLLPRARPPEPPVALQ
eukprot:scaffold60014_cov67-Phaeocystis_antarctica.AAC.4